MIGITIGGARLLMPDMKAVRSPLVGQTSIDGCIAEAPEKRPTFARYLVRSSGEDILVTDRTYWPEFRFGDCVHVIGKVEEPTSGKDMDYRRYLASQGIHAEIGRAHV